MVDIKPALPVSTPSLVSQEIFNPNSKATPTSTPSNSSTVTGDNGSNNNNINNNGIPECLATSPSATSSSLLALSYWTLCYSFISTTISKAADRLQNRSSGECAAVFMTQTATLSSSDSSNNVNSFHSNNFNNDNLTFNNNSSQQTLQTSRIKSKRQLQQQIASSSIDNSSSTPSTRLRNPSRPIHQASTPGTSSFSSLMRTKTLILDLDETLIHSTSRGSRADAQMVEVMVNKHACLYYAYKRPYVDHFLKKVSEWYKVVIFTASMPEYADPVIDWLDPDKNLISSRYYRQSCTNRDGSYIKDLTLVEPDLSKVCLVDNCSTSYSMHQENGIPIEGWINDPNDEALLDLLPFLDALRFTEDVRSVLSLRNFS